MKVAFVSQPWDTLCSPVSSGSIPIWTYRIARVLSRTCDVVIYARRSEQQQACEVAEAIEYRRVSPAATRLCNGVAKAIAQRDRSFRYLNSRLYYLPYAIRVASDLRQQACDVVHIHNFSQFVPIIRALNPTIKIVLHMHCEWLTQFNRQIVAARLTQCDLVIGCSDYITEKIKARFPDCADKCRCVYNGVDTDQFQPIDRPINQPVDRPVDRPTDRPTDRQTRKPKIGENEQAVLFVGRLSPEKGLHTLIAAFEQVAAKFPRAKLYMVGPDKPTSAEFIAELSDDPAVQRLAELDPPHYPQNLRHQLPPELKSRVVFPGQVSHLEMHDYFQSAQVLVNPSLSEAFGMSLVEAMASGLPTVATAVGGMVDIVESGKTGLLVPPDRPEALANAITQLLSNPELSARMGTAGRTRAVELFDWQAIAAHLHACYRQLPASEAIP